jgi:glycerophosphoryl diester phosphodiesterase
VTDKRARETPLLRRLRALSADGPIAVGHRGDSRHWPENTLAAFKATVALGAPMIEFDVQATADGELVCLHDATLDRTSDSAAVLGPGALVAQLTMAEIARLDLGGGERVPTLTAAMAAMLPGCVPMIEHKAGAAAAYAALLTRLGVAGDVLVQSFDWQFVRAMRECCGDVTLGLLGPGDGAAALDDSVLAAAAAVGASFVHWDARQLTVEQVAAARAAGFWVCTYTTDDDLGLLGGAALGLDAMCSNDPGHMLALRRAGQLRRR